MNVSSSNPESPNFAQHWTPEQVVKTFAPSDDTIAAVADWLEASGISRQRITHSDNKGWLAFQATASEAENLLHTEFHGYSHEHTGHEAVACDQYHVPAHVQEHIDYITPGVKLLSATKVGTKSIKKRGFGIQTPPRFVSIDAMETPLPSPTDLSTCDQFITPICLQALYDFKPFSGIPNPKNSMGLFEEGDFYDQE